MSIQKANSHIDVYRIRALSGNAQCLSGRAAHEQTDTINSFILSKAPNSQDAVVVDVGCGDGSLLMKFSAKSKLGIVPTKEEKRLLDTHWRGQINVQIGKADKLDLPNKFADIVILSGVIILLDRDTVLECLKEIGRIAKNQAWIYIGDVPELDEMQKIEYGDSIVDYLLFLYHENGLTRVFKELLKLGRAMLGLDNYVIKPKKIFHISPNDFIKLCETKGFHVVEHGKQVEWNLALQSCVESSTRWYYILKA